MRVPISGLVLLIVATLLWPAPVAAVQCAKDPDEPAGYIADGVWRYHAFDAPLSGGWRPIVRVAASGSIDRGMDRRHIRPSVGVGNRPPSANRVRVDAAESIGAWANLDTPFEGSANTSGGEEQDRMSGWPKTISIPEPDNWAMLIAGLLGVWTVARRRMPPD